MDTAHEHAQKGGCRRKGQCPCFGLPAHRVVFLSLILDKDDVCFQRLINSCPKIEPASPPSFHKVPQMLSDVDQDLSIPGSYPSGMDYDAQSQPRVTGYDNVTSGPQDMSQSMIDFAQRSRMSSLV